MEYFKGRQGNRGRRGYPDIGRIDWSCDYIQVTAYKSGSEYFSEDHQ